MRCATSAITASRVPDRSPVWLEPDFGRRCEMVRGGTRCRYGSALVPVCALAPLGGAVAGVGVGCLVGRAPELGRAEGLSLGGGLAAEGCRATLARFGRCAAVRAPRLAAFAWLAASGGHLAGLVRLVVTCLAARLSAARARPPSKSGINRAVSSVSPRKAGISPSGYAHCRLPHTLTMYLRDSRTLSKEGKCTYWHRLNRLTA